MQRLLEGKAGGRGKVVPDRHSCKGLHVPQRWWGGGFAYEKLLRTLSKPSHACNSLVMGWVPALCAPPLPPSSRPSSCSHMCLPPTFPGSPCTGVESLSKQPEDDITTIVSTSCPQGPYTRSIDFPGAAALCCCRGLLSLSHAWERPVC